MFSKYSEFVHLCKGGHFILMTIARPGISLFRLMEKNSISSLRTKGFFLITTLRGSVAAVCHHPPTMKFKA